MSLDDVAPSSVSVLVDAVIFSDNFAAGESDAISELIRIRQYNVRKMQGRLKLLRSFATWSSASAIRLKLEEARQTRDPNTLFLQRLSQQLEKSDAASWEAYVARQIDWTERAAQLFEGSVKALESHSREPR